MATFLIGIAILIVGGALYGRLVEKVFRPDDRPTPAVTKQDGVDYVPMPKWKNSLINLLNIAGTGPILGPIQGILFGPIAFITIPIGCIIGGAVHDYFLRDDLHARGRDPDARDGEEEYEQGRFRVLYYTYLSVAVFDRCGLRIHSRGYNRGYFRASTRPRSRLSRGPRRASAKAA